MGFKLQEDDELEASASNSKVLGWALDLALPKTSATQGTIISVTSHCGIKRKCKHFVWTCFFPLWNCKSGFAVFFWNYRKVPEHCSRKVSLLGSNIRNGKSPWQERVTIGSPRILTCLLCSANRKMMSFYLNRATSSSGNQNLWLQQS